MIITKEEIATVLAGCDGVAPGPWVRTEEGENQTFVDAPSGRIAQSFWSVRGTDAHRRAAHIARLSPEFVRDLATLALEALSSRDAGWQSIETAPATSLNPCRVLVYDPRMKEPIEIRLSDGGWWRLYEASGPTHWRPLPNPPEAGLQGIENSPREHRLEGEK